MLTLSQRILNKLFGYQYVIIVFDEGGTKTRRAYYLKQKDRFIVECNGKNYIRGLDPRGEIDHLGIPSDYIISNPRRVPLLGVPIKWLAITEDVANYLNMKG